MRRLAGAAHIIHLSNDGSWELTRRLGKRMSVFGGAVRLYRQVLTEQWEEPFEHPLWLAQGMNENLLLRQLANRVFPATFLRENQEEPFPRYAAVRDAAARRALSDMAAEDEEAQAAAKLVVAQLELAERAEEADVWQSLAQEAVERREAAELEIERLKAEIARLENKSAFFAMLVHVDFGARTVSSAPWRMRRKSQRVAHTPARSLGRTRPYGVVVVRAMPTASDGRLIDSNAFRDARMNFNELF